MTPAARRLDLRRLPGAAPAFAARVDADGWRATAHAVREEGGRLVALWGGEDGDALAVHVALATAAGLLVLTLPVARDAPVYPGIAAEFPGAARMQRAVADLLGLQVDGCDDGRPWLRHGAWPADAYPLRAAYPAERRCAPDESPYTFVPVAGEGVHEIAVGPVHAGTIEPGHFRFSVVGERVLRLEARLGYKHKGIEKRFAGMTPAEGARLAARVSGDSSVAYGWAYAMAAEGVCDTAPPPRARWLRALLLERERIAAHLGDLGFIGNDAGLAFGLSQFSLLKEAWLRTNARLFGHRYLMDAVVPGGVACDLDAAAATALAAEADALAAAVARLRAVYDEHAGLQDRLLACGRVAPALAARLGLAGLAGRASAQALDLRAQFPCEPYDGLDVKIATRRNGDVAARVAVRFDEIAESLRLLRALVAGMPAGAVRVPLAPAAAGAAIGWIEGWRGEVLVALETDAGGRLARCHPHDPSWLNWPALEHAVIDNIVPDFPLINKSFNLSYSGHDL